MRLLAIDPGKEKCGLALVEAPETILQRAIVSTSRIGDAVQGWFQKWNPERVLLGDGTFSKSIEQAILPLLSEIPLILVNEWDSTYRSRQLYFRYNPPRGIWRWIPLGLQVPPEPYDDFAAAFFAFRYLQEKDKEFAS